MSVRVNVAAERRRRDVAKMQAKGCSVRMIARSLGIHEGTVRADLKRLGLPTSAKPVVGIKSEPPTEELEPVTVRCAHCGFQAGAAAEEAPRVFAAHSCDRPKPPPRSHRQRGYRIRGRAR